MEGGAGAVAKRPIPAILGSMSEYGYSRPSLTTRLFRWLLKVAVVNGAITGAFAYGLHRAYPARTMAAWNAFWVKDAPKACEVPLSPKKAGASAASAPRAETGGMAPIRMSGSRSVRIPAKGGGSAQTPCDVDTAKAAPPPGRVLQAGAGPSSGKEVVVYGRDACGLTSRMRSQLTQAGIPFRYASVDDAAGGGEVSAKLRTIGHSGGFGLPVVSVGASVFIRPTLDTVAGLYNNP